VAGKNNKCGREQQVQAKTTRAGENNKCRQKQQMRAKQKS
jgi:hypothetical protein